MDMEMITDLMEAVMILCWTVLADFHPEIMGFQNCERKEPFL